MKTECTPRLALLNRRGLIGFALYAAGLVLAFGAMSPSVTAQANGRWTVTGDLVTARQGHTATLLPNGQVLVAGGLNDLLLASAELYNPAARMWMATGSMHATRAGHTATLLPSEQVLAVGGAGISRTPASCGTIPSGEWKVAPNWLRSILAASGTLRRCCRMGWCLRTAAIFPLGARNYTIRRLECGRRPAAWLLHVSDTLRRCCRTGRCWWPGGNGSIGTPRLSHRGTI